MLAAVVVLSIAVVLLLIFSAGMWFERNWYKEESERCLNGWHEATTDSSDAYQQMTAAQRRLEEIKSLVNQ